MFTDFPAIPQGDGKIGLSMTLPILPAPVKWCAPVFSFAINCINSDTSPLTDEKQT
jgi:hypothetical protein